MPLGVGWAIKAFTDPLARQSREGLDVGSYPLTHESPAPTSGYLIHVDMLDQDP